METSFPVFGGAAVNLSIRSGQPQAFGVDEKESIFLDERAAERGAEIVLYQVIVAHGLKCAGVHGPAAQKFIRSSVKLAGAGMGDDIDLSAARAAHIRGIAACFHLEFFHRVRRRT